jgi:tungstate transport system ATP-binding protein
MDALFSLEDLRFCRDDFTLEIERLELEPGRIYLLQGPNGSGKSTLLGLLALLLVPQRGRLLFDGNLIRGTSDRQRLRRQISLVEQSPFLFNSSVYQNLAFGLRLRNIRGDLQERRIAQALQVVGLEGFEQRRARELSGGESRRVALARALVLKPRLILLDEPTAGLDRDVLPIFERCLTALPEQNTTVVLAGHDQEQPQRLATAILKMERGRILPSTPTHQMKETV